MEGDPNLVTAYALAGTGVCPAEGEELAQMRHEQDRRGRQMPSASAVWSRVTGLRASSVRSVSRAGGSMAPSIRPPRSPPR